MTRHRFIQLKKPDLTDQMVIARIAARAMIELKMSSVRVHVDLMACHANGCPLSLNALLTARDMHFAHDIHGICAHIDRRTGQLKNQFKPRYARDQ